jgi:hypothetical protein
MSGRTRVEKLGVKPGLRIAVIGFPDEAFLAELSDAGALVKTRYGSGSFDMVVLRLDRVLDLPLLLAAKKRIVSNGMIWAVWPKGRKEFREDDIRHFGPQAGLVDVKVMAFSEILSGLKLVIPLAQR